MVISKIVAPAQVQVGIESKGRVCRRAGANNNDDFAAPTTTATASAYDATSDDDEWDRQVDIVDDASIVIDAPEATSSVVVFVENSRRRAIPNDDATILDVEYYRQ